MNGQKSNSESDAWDLMGDKSDAVEEDGDGETSIPLLPLRVIFIGDCC